MKSSAALIMFVLILMLCELTTRVFYKSDTRLDEIIGILMEDSELFWRFKPNINVMYQGVEVSINSLGFRDEDFLLKKNEDSIRIVCLGASPTFGWGVTFDNIYPQKLEYMLRERFENKRIDVINAAVIGYSSYQGLLLLKNQILNFSPDVVTISYLINDVDKNRFYRSDGRSDKELERENQYVIHIRNIVSKSSIYKLMQRTIHRLFLRKMISGSRRSIKLPQIRVSIDDYVQNLSKMIEICRKNNIKAVLIKMPLNLPPPPYISEASSQKSDRLMDEGRKYMDIGFYDEAISKFKEVLVISPFSSEGHYYLGVCYEFKKDYKSAEAEFEKAKDYDSFRCRLDSEVYNEAMDRVANEENIPLIDIVSIFKNENDKKLFLYEKSDPIHPDILGHRLIAEEIYKILLERDIIL